MPAKEMEDKICVAPQIEHESLAFYSSSFVPLQY